MRQRRERQRAGMLAGDERYLQARDRGPQRRWVRDQVDARFTLGELLIPVMIVVIIVGFTPQSLGLYAYAVLILWGYFLLLILDMLIMALSIRRRAKREFPEVERGLAWYGAMRALQSRRMRVPLPQVRVGGKPVKDKRK